MNEAPIPEGLREMTALQRAEACLAESLAMLVEAYLALDRELRDEQ